MTDYSKMTDEQINEAIFKAKGWVELPPPAAPPWQRPSDGGVESWHSSFPPDYIHDWRLCGELLEEMRDKCLVSLMNGRLDNPAWVCSIFLNPAGISTIASTPQRVICEAWLAWKEQDV
jgi:hypothetical protein